MKNEHALKQQRSGAVKKKKRMQVKEQYRRSERERGLDSSNDDVEHDDVMM